MKCRIFRNYDTDTIEKVENPNGEPSTLFKDINSSIKDKEKAVDMWAFAYTDAFKKVYGEWEKNPENYDLRNGEPKAEHVLNAYYLKNNEGKMTLRERLDALDLSLKDGIMMKELFEKLKSAFFDKNNNFVIDGKKLRKSGLYSEQEVLNILTYPSVGENILASIEKMSNDDSIFEDDTAVVESFHIPNGKISSLGSLESINSQDVLDHVRAYISEFTSDEEFYEQINSLPNEIIREGLLSDPEAYEEVKEEIKSTKGIEVKVYNEGKLENQTTRNLYNTLLNTVKVDEIRDNFNRLVREAHSKSDFEWQDDSFFKLIEEEAALAGIDISGLSKYRFQKSREDVLDLLDLIDDFNSLSEEKNIDDNDIKELSEGIDEFFGEETKNQKEFIQRSYSTENLDLISIRENVSESELLENTGYIKYQGNIFRNVGVTKTLDEAVDKVYNDALEDYNSINTEVLDGTTIAELVDPNNELEIKNRIKNRIESINKGKDSKVELLKGAYGEFQEETIPSFEEFRNRLKNINDVGYYSSDFISDFYRIQLIEKVSNSELYNNALKYFEITDSGVRIRPINEAAMSRLKTTINSDTELKDLLSNYASMSKNYELSDLVNKSDIDSDIDTDYLSYLVNYPEVVPALNKDYIRVTDNTILTKGSKNEFIRIGDSVYGLLETSDGMSKYGKLIGVKDDNYIVKQNVFVENEDINFDEYIDNSNGSNDVKLLYNRHNKAFEENSCMI